MRRCSFTDMHIHHRVSREQNMEPSVPAKPMGLASHPGCWRYSPDPNSLSGWRENHT